MSKIEDDDDVSSSIHEEKTTTKEDKIIENVRELYNINEKMVDFFDNLWELVVDLRTEKEELSLSLKDSQHEIKRLKELLKQSYLKNKNLQTKKKWFFSFV